MPSSRFLLLTISLTLMIILGDNGSNAAEEDDFDPNPPTFRPLPATIFRGDQRRPRDHPHRYRGYSSHTPSSSQTLRTHQPDPGRIETSPFTMNCGITSFHQALP